MRCVKALTMKRAQYEIKFRIKFKMFLEFAIINQIRATKKHLFMCYYLVSYMNSKDSLRVKIASQAIIYINIVLRCKGLSNNVYISKKSSPV